MADYRQPKYLEKRLRYFDGQFLKDQDFIDEQKYHVDRQRRHNWSLHAWGIVEGLTVNTETNLATVEAGTAVDRLGRQIVLGNERSVALSDYAGQTVDLAILYAEEGSDQAQEGSAGHTRFYENPELQVITQGENAPASSILLARLAIDANGNVTVDESVRIYAGLHLPDGRANRERWPALRAGAQGRVDLSGDLRVSGTGSFSGNVGIGTTEPRGFQVVLPESSKSNRPGAGITMAGGADGNASIELRNSGSGTPYIDFAQNATQTDYDARIRLTAPNKLAIEGANVGIGTTSPVEQLEVNGNIKLSGSGKTIQFIDATTSGGVVSKGTVGAESYVEMRVGVPGPAFGGRLVIGRWSTDSTPVFEELMRVGSNGNVGIGTTNPGARLEVVAGSKTWGGWYEAIRLGQSAHSAITHPGGGLLFGLHGNRRFYFSDTVEGQHIMTIDANPSGGGNVGIGTTNPGAKLEVRTPTNPASGEPIFRVLSSGGSERLRVEHDGALKTSNRLQVDGTGDSYIRGNVGIGTTSPGGFQVVLPESSKSSRPGAGITMAGGVDGNASIELRNSGSGTPYIDFVQNATQTDYDARIRLTAPNKLAIEGANVGIGATSPGEKLEVAGNLKITGARIRSAQGYGIVETNATDWLRINPDQHYPAIALYKPVAIGTGGLAVGDWSQQPAGQLKVTGNAVVGGRVEAGYVYISNRLRILAGDGQYWEIYPESWDKPDKDLFFDFSGNPSNWVSGWLEPMGGGWRHNSDKRLKRNIEPFDNVLDRVMKLRPKSYNWIGTAEDSEKSFGFIAQDVEEVLPEFVNERREFKALNYDYFAVLAIAAIQEQQALIQQLQEEIEGLKKAPRGKGK